MTAPDLGPILERIVRPVLQYLDAADPGQWSRAAEQLMMGTLVQESAAAQMFQIARAGGGQRATAGPALGLWQVEPATHDDIWANWLHYRPQLRAKVETLAGGWPPQGARHLLNPYYGVAIARQVFRRAPERLPPRDDVEGLAAYYKRVYNTPLGLAVERDWAAKYRAQVAPLFARGD